MKKLIFLLLFATLSFGAFAQSDTLVTNTITINGSNSNDKDNVNGGIVKYQWTQISGPSTTITNANSPNCTVTFNTYGVAVVQLTVTNKAGLTDSQQTQITMLAGDNKPHAVIIAVPILKMPPQK